MREIHIGIGSNLGDRQSNILAALQRLRARVYVSAVSAFYESAAADGAEGPAYLNVAAALRTELSRDEFERFARDVELAVGRAGGIRKLAPRPIDIDLLAVDNAIVRDDLQARAYNAVPLAEIAPHFVAARPNGSVRRRERSLHFATDRQEEEPDVRLSLDRAGRLGRAPRGSHRYRRPRTRLQRASFRWLRIWPRIKPASTCRRLVEILEEASLDVLARVDRPARAERLVEAIAREIVRSQQAVRAEVTLRAEFALERWTPVSGRRGEETYTLIGIANADEQGTRSVTGVEAEGLTACPCAQGMIREHSMHELRDAGFSEADARRALDALPVATHNQRGRGLLLLGADGAQSDAVCAEDLVEIVESSMSSETYDLLKRPDEFFIVNKAHHNPKFVEDVVRGILSRVLDMYADFDDDTFVSARPS